MFGNGVSLADIAAVTGNQGNNGNNGWGDGNGWWVLIILFALFGGWGRGYGNQGNNGGSDGSGSNGYIEAAIQRGFDNQGVTNKLNGLENGLCSLGYDQLAQMNNIQQSIMQTGYATQTQLQNCCCNIENAVQANTVAGMQSTNALQNQIQQCCCNLESLFAQANYNRATDTCNIINAIQQANQAAMQNCNNNYRALHDELVDIRMQGKDEQIAQLQAALNKCDTQNMITAGNQYVIRTLQPTPGPSYIVPNPYTGFYGYPNYYQGGCCNNGCGNGWNGQF